MAEDGTVGGGSLDDVVVLGTEMAAAMETERRHVPAGPSPIADLDYPEGSGDLWRWVERPQDAALSAFIRSYTGGDEPSRAPSKVKAPIVSMDWASAMHCRRSGWRPMSTSGLLVRSRL
jgi:hypothetical protein